MGCPDKPGNDDFLRWGQTKTPDFQAAQVTR
jgi:hypothetical protein